MDITFLTSVRWVEKEVVILMTGTIHVILSSKDVVCNLQVWVETLVWETMLVHHTDLAVSTVTVSSTMTLFQLVLHLSEL